MWFILTLESMGDNKYGKSGHLHIYIYEYLTSLKHLKGKFSSGREGALASKFNYDFK